MVTSRKLSDSPVFRAAQAKPLDLPFFRGICIAGMNRSQGVGDFTQPTLAGVRYWVRKGFNLFRLPINWMNIEPAVGGVPGGSYHAGNVAALKRTVDMITSTGAFVMVEFHDSLRYGYVGDNRIIGATAGVEVAKHNAVWAMLANLFLDNPRVLLEPQNEPHDVTNAQMIAVYQGMIDAVRAVGSTHAIVLDGNNYSDNQTWESNGTGAALLTLTDPLDRLIFAPHLYLDQAGGQAYPPVCTIGQGPAELITPTYWARKNGKKLLLGEWGFGAVANCYIAGKEALDFVENSRDVWVGSCAFAAYMGQKSYNTPDDFWLGMDPDAYEVAPTDDPRITNVFDPFLKDVQPVITVTAVVATNLASSGGTASNQTVADNTNPAGNTTQPSRRLIENTANAEHGIYTGNINTTQGKKHTLQFDVKRVGTGTGRDIRVKLQSADYANYAIADIDLDTGKIGYVSGNNRKLTRPTASVRQIDNNTFRVSVSTIVSDMTGFTAMNGNFIMVVDALVANASDNPNYLGAGTAGIEVWNIKWKVVA
jgi:endoglucanase